MKNNGIVIGVVFVAVMVIIAVSIPTIATRMNSENQEQIIIGTPWFPGDIDKLNKLGTDEILALAEENETIRELVEKDRQIEPAQIEGLEDVLISKAASIMSDQSLANGSKRSTVIVWVWIAADEEYRDYFGSNWQTEAYNTIESADNAFFRDHDISFVVGKYSEWDSNDNIHDSRLLAEVQEETGWNDNHQGMDMLAAFTNQPTDHRGWAELVGDAWIMKHQITSGWDWHLAQHESSHNYYCPDHGYWGPYCIMTYTFMMVTDQWCDDCDQTIEDNRNHF